MKEAIFRFTLGPTNDSGFKCLLESIRYLRKIYSFDIYVCCNNTPNEYKQILSKIVKVKDNDPKSLPVTPKVENWKLYPPRLNIDSYEIICDNDLIITKQFPKINQFLNSDKFLLMEGKYRNLGQFDRLVPKGYTLNSGLYGLPPGYDFHAEIIHFLEKTKFIDWSPRFDDQGLIAAILGNKSHVYITQKEIQHVLHDEAWQKGCYGYHFLGLNRHQEHKPFKTFIKQRNIFL